MFSKPIDFKKLHKELSETYARQKEIKAEYPHEYVAPLWTVERCQSGEYKKDCDAIRPWFEAYREFYKLSRKMTLLCCILNHAKGKLHMYKYRAREWDVVDLEKQAKLIGEKWKDYIKDETQDENVVSTFVAAMGG